MKKILIIKGSPRRNGNTDQLAEAFARGAMEAGHEVKFFSAATKEIKGCKACMSCWTDGKPCVIKDDFTELYPLLEEADVLVYSTPLYWFSFPTQLKSTIDRMYAYIGAKSKKALKVKESVLMVCGADDEKEVYEGIVRTFEEISHYMKWENRGILISAGVGEKGAVEATGNLQKAFDLGKGI